ncbi:MAG: DUF1566 domain-containing protein [Gammaproteobacteria bacterium]|nr:DUF1566 domain-containing protein [Gammaproteobacteria bacterium]
MKRILGLLLLFVFASSDAALVSRLGGQAYYDDVLNITWTADANINGADDWDAQVAWAAALDINGVTGWRLPSIDVDGGGIFDCATSTQAECTDNEYGHLFYYGADTIKGNGNEIDPDVDASPFTDVQSDWYWSSTLNGSLPYFFNFSEGTFTIAGKATNIAAWAVKDGDVGVVPIPAAVWLFGSALGLLGWVRRKAA